MDFEEMRGAYQRATQDDIVPELRAAQWLWEETGLVSLIWNEAADEIERLRTELANKQ